MNKTKKLTTLGLLGALSVLMVTVIHFPIFSAVPFMEYDPADIPIFIATFLFGPLSGFILTVVVSLIQGLTVSSASGLVGILMHIIATGSFVIVAGNIYKLNKTRKQAAVALFAGVVAMVIVMTLWDIFVLPLYMGVPRKAVIELLLFIVAFNFIKAGVNGIITMLVYKKVSVLIHKKIK